MREISLTVRIRDAKLKQVYLEVKMQDVHLVHVLQPFTDLAYEQHRVQLCQVVVLVDDAVKQLPSLHTRPQREAHAELQQERACNFAVLTNEYTRCTNCTHTCRGPDLLFHDQDDVMARLKGGVQLDEVGVVELVHHLDLIPDHLLRDRQTETENAETRTSQLTHIQSSKGKHPKC